MKKKILVVIMVLLFVADVVMSLFNFDIFSRFLKEKRKMKKELKDQYRYIFHPDSKWKTWGKSYADIEKEMGRRRNYE